MTDEEKEKNMERAHYIMLSIDQRLKHIYRLATLTLFGVLVIGLSLWRGG